jgi:hypothetical protein
LGIAHVNGQEIKKDTLHEKEIDEVVVVAYGKLKNKLYRFSSNDFE